MKHSPRISVVILTNDRPALLEKALRSIRRQTRAPEEIIIVDDSSALRDETKAVIQKYTANLPIIKRNTQHSISYGRTIGARASTGDIIIFLDDDCSASPRYIADFLRHFRKTPGLAAVFGRITNAYPDNVYASTQYAYYDRGLRRFFPALTKPTAVNKGRILDCEVMAIKRATLLSYGFRERHRWYRNDDVELGLELISGKERVVFDPAITAAAHPRTALRPLWIAAFWNGYSDACTESIRHINLREAPHPSPFFPWWIRELRRNRSYGLVKQLWYGLLLISFPAVSRIGKLWYFLQHHTI